MAEGLKLEGNSVSIICPLPNYPNGEIFKKYKKKFRVNETIKGISVIRYWIYPTISKKPLLRFFSMISFAITLWCSVFKLCKKKPDLIIVQSPPLLIAFSGLLLSKLLRVKNILNVSDIWPLSALELGVIKKGKFYRFLEKIERKNYLMATKVVGQSEEIINHVCKKVDRKTLIYRNTPIYKEYDENNRSKNLTIVYAGLLGFAQGILKICKNIDFEKLNIEFHIYGAGMEEKEIVAYIKKGGKPIYFHGSVSALEIKSKIRNYDIALVPLLKTIYGAVPSKIFEMMQLGMPMLYIGGGEAAEIIKKNSIGLVSKPDDFITFEENILLYKNMSDVDYYTYVKNNLSAHKKEFHLSFQLKKLNQFIIPQ